MAPTDVKFPLNPSGEIVPYNYTIDYSPMKGRDVLKEFVDSCQKRQIQTGFYYSVVSNNYLNVQSGVVCHETLDFSINIMCLNKGSKSDTGTWTTQCNSANV